MLTLGVVKDTLEPDTPFLLPQLSRVDIVLLGEIIENEHAMQWMTNKTLPSITWRPATASPKRPKSF